MNQIIIIIILITILIIFYLSNNTKLDQFNNLTTLDLFDYYAISVGTPGRLDNIRAHAKAILSCKTASVFPLSMLRIDIGHPCCPQTPQMEDIPSEGQRGRTPTGIIS